MQSPFFLLCTEWHIHRVSLNWGRNISINSPISKNCESMHVAKRIAIIHFALPCFTEIFSEENFAQLMTMHLKTMKISNDCEWIHTLVLWGAHTYTKWTPKFVPPVTNFLDPQNNFREKMDPPIKLGLHGVKKNIQTQH